MKQKFRNEKKLLTHEADEGLRKLRKDAGTAYRWAQKKWSLRKIKKMKITDQKVNDKF